MEYANYIVPGSFSRLILVQWTRPTIKYANYMVPGSFSRFILVHRKSLTLNYANYMVPRQFLSFHFSPPDMTDSKLC